MYLFEEALADELRLSIRPPMEALPAHVVTPQHGNQGTKESLLRKLKTTPPTLTSSPPSDAVKDNPALDATPIFAPRDKKLC